MKKVILSFALGVLTLGVLSISFPQVFSSASALFKSALGSHQILAKDLLQQLATNEKITLLDVRTAREYEFMHPYGAINIHYSHLEKQQAQIPRDSKIVTLCSSGPRAEKATRKLLALGFTDVATLIGGIEALVVESWEFTPKLKPLPADVPVYFGPDDNDDDEEEDMGC